VIILWTALLFSSYAQTEVASVDTQSGWISSLPYVKANDLFSDASSSDRRQGYVEGYMDAIRLAGMWIRRTQGFYWMADELEIQCLWQTGVNFDMYGSNYVGFMEGVFAVAQKAKRLNDIAPAAFVLVRRWEGKWRY